MESIGWFVIVPLCFASLLTGLVMPLGTAWGLFRHYWVVAKLLIAIVATILLLVHAEPLAGRDGTEDGDEAEGDPAPRRPALRAPAHGRTLAPHATTRETARRAHAASAMV
jgi:hypothetical protein